MAIGSKLTELMKQKGTNANELAQAVNVAPTTIYSLIRRDGTKTDINLLARIAMALDVDMMYFSDEKKPQGAADGENESDMMIPSYESMRALIARGTQKLTDKDKMQLIRLLSETDD